MRHLRPAFALPLLLLGCGSDATSVAPRSPPVQERPRLRERWWHARRERVVADRPDLVTCTYDVGALLDPPHFPAWSHPDPDPPPRFEGGPGFEDADACPRCVGVGGGGAAGGVLTFDEEPPPGCTREALLAEVLALSRDDLDWVAPHEARLDPGSAQLVVTHGAAMHARIRALLRPRLCPHDD
jgi:hypothetical protein